MEVERSHHHHNNSTSELLICFTSRLSSSSSMKLTPKSILSPGRNREPSQISLSTSLSRRLRNNGSIKGSNGQASPMFPTTTGKKRGCAFENPEPSSPKVTCIGQVRVKTKKQGKKMRAARSKKRRGGEASFRKTEQGFSSDLQNLQQAEAGLTHRNQRWVHLPLTICEALRTFGAEFNCLFPCRSSSCGGGGGGGGREKEEEEKVQGKGEGSGGGHSREASCGAAFARWLVAFQEGEGKGREIELVVGEENKEVEEDDDRPERSRRRHVLEDIEIDMKKNDEEEEDKARVSICIPPKNALLLMRCRSDPVKMAALANRFWESPAPKDEVEQDAELQEQQKERGDDEERLHMEEEEEEEKQDRVQVPAVEEDGSICELSNEEQEVLEAEAELVIKTCESEILTTPEISEVAEAIEEKQEVQEEEEKEKEVDEVEVEESYNNGDVRDENLCDNSPEVPADLEKPELEEFHEENLQEEENGEDFCGDKLKIPELASSSLVIFEASETENNEEEEKVDISVTPETPAREATVESTEKEEEEKETEERPREDESTVTQERLSDPEYPKPDEPKQGPVLPDCLLLMMCEPKLSMEVSKETWVCSTDFVRWLPERPAKRKDGGDEPKKRISIDAKPPLGPPMQPPRSSCSFPAPTAYGCGGMSMASMIEQKLVGSNAYEPFVLTRCKSEPMRSSAKFAAPDACFWKNRKLEPHHRPATLGVGAAGIGF